MVAKKRAKPRSGRRAAVVSGLRTPFVKSNGVFADLKGYELASKLVSELMARADLAAEEVDQLVYGQVVPEIKAPNIAREIALATGLPRTVDAYSVSRACATGTQALVSAARAIEAGDADVVICGGVESLSNPPITFSDRFVKMLLKANSAKDPMAKAKAFAKLKLRDLMPNPPAIAEFSTGLTMGESAEVMAKANGIERAPQDQLAEKSHKNAVSAWDRGIYDAEVMPVAVGTGFKDTVTRDNLMRADTSFEKLSKLKPVFDRKYGTITAGNSSALTDGASALLVMSESKAKALGYEPLCFVKSWGFAAIDPNWQLLLGPAFASPLALDRAGMTLADIDIVDMHEAFAAQMLSNMQAFASDDFAREHLGKSEAVGEIPDEKLNPFGGSLALGHPFAATAGRQVLTMGHELRRRGSGTALVTQCAAGGIGAAVILERD
ncbi:MAG: acetyl-CoA C-acyltransferase FadI [Myxococcota bacterium]|nr:acetyl-CoA C-acyltransferase FadI [Myxococcota bacterium]